MIRHSRPTGPLRYYVYISDAKVDMLYEQIPKKLLRGLATEVKVDLKLMSVTLANAPAQEARMGKLSVVERYLERQNAIGKLDASGRYFRHQGPTQWGWLSYFDPASPSTVIFLGREAHDTVLLAGSRQHVIGEQRPSENVHASSATPNIIAVIGEHISQDPELGRQIRRWRVHPEPSEASAAVHDPPEAALSAAEVLRVQSPPQPMEYLAVRLLAGDVAEQGTGLATESVRHVTIATPVYVALSDG